MPIPGIQRNTIRWLTWVLLGPGVLCYSCSLFTVCFAKDAIPGVAVAEDEPAIAGDPEATTSQETHPHTPAWDDVLPVTATGSTDEVLVRQVHERLNREYALRQKRCTLDHLPAVPEQPLDQPRAMVAIAHSGTTYSDHDYLVFQLLVENPMDTPFTIRRDDIVARINHENKSLGDLPLPLKNFSFAYGTRHHNVQQAESMPELSVPAHGVAGTWLIYPEQTAKAELPPVVLTINLQGKPFVIDVNASQWAILDVTTETIGPRGCLALMTVHGLMNSVNVKAFADELEKLTDQKIYRFVVQWPEEALLPDPQLNTWLVGAVLHTQADQQDENHYPLFPGTIREFQLVQKSKQESSVEDRADHEDANFERSHIQQDARKAVSSALQSAFLALPKEELLREIEHGHRLSRLAAVELGASQLAARYLPLLIRLTEDADRELQVCAVRALGHFGEPSALETLLRIAQQPAEDLSAAAIEALAISRYAPAQKRLRELFQQHDPRLRKQVLTSIGRHPRPQWSEMIYQCVTESEESLTVDGIRALLQVGHPQLMDVLAKGLRHPQAQVRAYVFPILAQRADPRSEKLAADYVLSHLAEHPLDPTMKLFLIRTKLPAAVPLLLKQLETSSDKISLLNLLSEIGDETVGDAIASRMDRFNSTEKGQALGTLRTLRHPSFRGLAGEMLLSQDLSLVVQASQELQQDGSQEACQLLITALEKQTNPNTWQSLCSTLGNLGTPQVRRALREASTSEIAEKKNAALQGLNLLYQRSPGYQYIWQAQNAWEQNQEAGWKEALEYYELSLRIDSELPEAIAGCGYLQWRLGRKAEGAKHLENAYQLDPLNHLASAGLAEIRMVQGRLDEGIKILESGREQHRHDGRFLQIAGRAYAHAALTIDKNSEQVSTRSSYIQKAAADLRQAAVQGFNDLDSIRKAPEFKTLYEDPEFKALLDQPLPESPPIEAAVDELDDQTKEP